jgi:hypothetical protein
MNAQAKLRRTASQLLCQGGDPYNTAVEVAVQRQQMVDFADWVAQPLCALCDRIQDGHDRLAHEFTPTLPGLLRRQAD